MIKINFFKEIIRIISQAIETEYFYRWRKITYKNWTVVNKPLKIRALNHLNNTWDGDISILNIVNDKIFHMYVNLRKYGSTVSRYVPTSTLLDKGTINDKYIAFFKALDNEPKDTLKSNKLEKINFQELYIGNTRLKDENGLETEYLFFKENILDKKTKSLTEKYGIKKVSINKTGKTRIAHYLELDSNQNCNIVPKTEDITKHKIEDKHYFESKPTSLKEIKTFIENISGIKVIDKDLFYQVHDVELGLIEYVKLSENLKKHVIGRILGLHSLWEFRRMLNKLHEMDELDEPYYTLLNNKLNSATNDKDKASIRLQFHKDFLKDKKDYARQIADFYVDNCDSWWD